MQIYLLHPPGMSLYYPPHLNIQVNIMAALIIGGDNIKTIKDELHTRGISQIMHWSGRKHGDKNKVIPDNIELVVVMVNYVNHSFSNKVKKAARRLNLPVIYSKNSRHCFVSSNAINLQAISTWHTA
jgi:hypothetical protein